MDEASELSYLGGFGDRLAVVYFHFTHMQHHIHVSFLFALFALFSVQDDISKLPLKFKDHSCHKGFCNSSCMKK